MYIYMYLYGCTYSKNGGVSGWDHAKLPQSNVITRLQHEAALGGDTLVYFKGMWIIVYLYVFMVCLQCSLLKNTHSFLTKCLQHPTARRLMGSTNSTR